MSSPGALDAAALPRLAPVALLRSTPRAVWALAVAAAALAAFYVVAVPLLHAPDEHAHVDLVRTEPHLGLAPHEGAELAEQTLAALPLVHLVPVDWRVAPTGEPLAAAEARPRGQRPGWDELGPASDSGVLNNARTHPPLYYLALDLALDAGRAAVDAVEPGGWSWDLETGVLRLLNVAAAGVLPWFAFWTALRVRRRRDVALGAAALTLAVPQLSHIAGSVNNDTLLLALGGGLTLVTAWIATGDLSRRSGALAGVLAGAGMLTKVLAIGMPLWIAGAYAVAWRRRGGLRQAVTGLAVAAAATIAAGGWWVLRLLAIEGTPAPRGFAYDQPAGFDPSVGAWLGEVLVRMTRTFWGFFGVEQFHLPDPAVAAASVAGLVLVGAGLAAARRHRGPLVVLLLPVATILPMVLVAAWSGYARSGLPTGLHGRYLFAGTVGLAVVAAVGAARILPRRLGPAAALAAAVTLQGLGAWTVVRGYWAGPGVLDRLGALVAWAPWRPAWLALGAAVLVGALAVAGRELLPADAKECAGRPQVDG